MMLQSAGDERCAWEEKDEVDVENERGRERTRARGLVWKVRMETMKHPVLNLISREQDCRFNDHFC